MATRFDAIVVGTGQAGPPLAGRLTKAGWRVAIIERGRFGGTCVNYGCTPTKALLASARAAHMARRAADFGVAIDGPVRVDAAEVKARKDVGARPAIPPIAGLDRVPYLTNSTILDLETLPDD